MRVFIQKRITHSTSRALNAHPHWRGGFFDGDGSIFLTKSGRTLRPVVSITASISEDAAATITEFKRVYGGYLSEAHSEAEKRENTRPHYIWQVIGAAVFPVLSDLLASGLCIKWPQAVLLLQSKHLFPGCGNSGRKLCDTTLQGREYLKQELYKVRAHELSEMTIEAYKARLLALCPELNQRHAYAAGFCDADGCFSCCKGSRKHHYRVSIDQKNRSFLEAFKDVILDGMGANVHTTLGGMSTIKIGARAEVQAFCSSIYPFAVNKSRQLDVILTKEPSADAKVILASMHGNQGKRALVQVNALTTS